MRKNIFILLFIISLLIINSCSFLTVYIHYENKTNELQTITRRFSTNRGERTDSFTVKPAETVSTVFKACKEHKTGLKSSKVVSIDNYHYEIVSVPKTKYDLTILNTLKCNLVLKDRNDSNFTFNVNEGFNNFTAYKYTEDSFDFYIDGIYTNGYCKVTVGTEDYYVYIENNGNSLIVRTY